MASTSLVYGLILSLGWIKWLKSADMRTSQSFGFVNNHLQDSVHQGFVQKYREGTEGTVLSWNAPKHFHVLHLHPDYFHIAMFAQFFRYPHFLSLKDKHDRKKFGS